MTSEETRILEDLLISQGLDIRKAEDICLLLQFKPENVQRAFYLRCQGKTQEEIGFELGVPQTTVSYYLIEKCKDIKSVLTGNIGKT